MNTVRQRRQVDYLCSFFFLLDVISTATLLCLGREKSEKTMDEKYGLVQLVMGVPP